MDRAASASKQQLTFEAEAISHFDQNESIPTRVKSTKLTTSKLTTSMLTTNKLNTSYFTPS